MQNEKQHHPNGLTKLQWQCVEPIEEHARLVWQWRNEPTTRQMSIHTAEKPWHSFWNEFLSHYFSLKDLPPLFAIREGKIVAFVCFRPYSGSFHNGNKSCEISIIVNPLNRGQGIGTDVLQKVKSWVAQQGYEEIYAEVKPENIASSRAFLRAGYQRLGSTSKALIDHTAGVIQVLIDVFYAKLQSLNTRSTTYVIAEAGSNWRVGSYKRDLCMAKSLIVAAKEAGADAIKFQTFRAHTVYAQNAGQADYLSDQQFQEDISNIFEDLSMPYEMLPELAKICEDYEIDFMSTPFSERDFKEVNPYVHVHKIASYEIAHLRLIQLAAQSGKPLLLSTGASGIEDIWWAIHTFYSAGGKKLTLLQCCAAYPAPLESLNLKAIPWMKDYFRVDVGLSDHSRDPLIAPLAAVALGASVIEKHFTLSNRLPGPDHFFSITVEEFKQMVKAIRDLELSLGKGFKSIQPCEMELRRFCHRRIQAAKPIMQGDILHEGDNIAILRPGKQNTGVHPSLIDTIEGKRATRSIHAGEGIQFTDWA